MQIIYSILGVATNDHEIEADEQLVKVELSLVTAGGDTPWSWTSNIGMFPAIWPREEGQIPPDQAAERLAWLHAERWAEELPLPQTFYPLLQQPIGTTSLPLPNVHPKP